MLALIVAMVYPAGAAFQSTPQVDIIGVSKATYGARTTEDNATRNV